MEKLVDYLKETRVKYDLVLKLIDKLPNSRGKALAYTSLQKGRMYLGEVSRDLGTVYPYEKTKTATTAEGIQKAVDTSSENPTISGNEIEQLNKLRDVLQEGLDSLLKEFFTLVKTRKTTDLKSRFELDADFAEAYRSIKESRIWLGVRLGEIKDQSNG